MINIFLIAILDLRTFETFLELFLLETEFSRPVTARKREGSSKRNSASSNSSDSYRSMENSRIPESLAEDLESETSELTHGET